MLAPPEFPSNFIKKVAAKEEVTGIPAKLELNFFLPHEAVCQAAKVRGCGKGWGGHGGVADSQAAAAAQTVRGRRPPPAFVLPAWPSSLPRCAGGPHGFQNQHLHHPHLPALFRPQVDLVLIPAVTGDFGAMPGHVPTVAQLRPGLLTIHTELDKDVQVGAAELSMLGGDGLHRWVLGGGDLSTRRWTDADVATCLPSSFFLSKM